jgi:DNA-binding GntR family transcriptional regulator
VTEQSSIPPSGPPFEGLADPPPGAGGPRYRQIAEVLAADIRRGRFAIGALLPGEMELCAQYGVSRHTARDALRLLQDQGLIRRRRGAGTQVVDPTDSAGPFAQEWGGVGDILQYARDARLEIHSLGPASVSVLAALGLDPVSPWQMVTGVRVPAGGGEPLALTRICARASLMPGRRELDAWPGALAELIASRGGPVTRTVEQTITAVLLERSEARLLSARTGGPALRTVRRYRDPQGELFQASLSLHPADRFAWHMVVER